MVLFCAISGLVPSLAQGQTTAGSASSSVQVTIPPDLSQNGFTGSVPSGQATAEVLQETMTGFLGKITTPIQSPFSPSPSNNR